MNLRERWIDYLYRAASGNQKYRSARTPIGLTIFGLFTALFIVFSITSDKAFNLPWPFPDKFSQIIAHILLIIGAGLVLWTGFQFRKARGTPVPVNPPQELVVEGPYRLTRNPMLTGVFLAMIGLGFLIHSLSLVFVFTPLYALAHAWELKNIEEPELIKRFGDDFISYRERTPMFIPRIRPGKLSAGLWYSGPPEIRTVEMNSDLPAIDELLQAEEWPLVWEDLEVSNCQPDAVFNVAIKDGEFAGFFATHSFGRVGYLYLIIIDHKFRRKGIARPLYSKTLRSLRANGAQGYVAHTT